MSSNSVAIVKASQPLELTPQQKRAEALQKAALRSRELQVLSNLENLEKSTISKVMQFLPKSDLASFHSASKRFGKKALSDSSSTWNLTRPVVIRELNGFKDSGLLNIMSYLNGEDLCRAAGTSRRFCRLTSSPMLWNAEATRLGLGRPINPNFKQDVLYSIALANCSYLVRGSEDSWNRTCVVDPRDDTKPLETNPYKRFEKIKPYLCPANATPARGERPATDLTESPNEVLSEASEPLTASDIIKSSGNIRLLRNFLSWKNPNPEELTKALTTALNWIEEAYGYDAIDMLLDAGAVPDLEMLHTTIEKCKMSPEDTSKLICKFLDHGVKPTEKTLNLALGYVPQAARMLLRNGAPVSLETFQIALSACQKNSIPLSFLEEVMPLCLKLPGFSLNLEAAWSLLQINQPFSWMKSRIEEIVAVFPKERANDLSFFLKVALQIPFKYENRAAREEVINYLLDQQIPLSSEHLNNALFAGQPTSLILRLLKLGVKFDERSLEYGVRGECSKETIQILLDLGAHEIAKRSSYSGNDYLGRCSEEVLRMILPKIKEVSDDDVIAALERNRSLAFMEMLVERLPEKPRSYNESARIVCTALENGSPIVPLLIKKYGFHMPYKHHKTDRYNAFNSALKHSRDPNWLQSAINLGAKPDRESYQLALDQGAPDETLVMLEKMGFGRPSSHGPYGEIMSKAVLAKASIQTLERLIKQNSPLASSVWNTEGAYADVERFKLLYEYWKSKPSSFQDSSASSEKAESGPYVTLALQNRAQLPVLQYLHSQGFPFPVNAVELAFKQDGRMDSDELAKIIDWLFQLGFKATTKTLNNQFKHDHTLSTSKVNYFLRHGAVPDRDTFCDFFAKHIPFDLGVRLSQILFNMRDFSQDPDFLKYYPQNGLLGPVFNNKPEVLSSADSKENKNN